MAGTQCTNAQFEATDVLRALNAAEADALWLNFGLELRQADIANLTYLLDKRWVKREEVQKTFQVKTGSVPSSVAWYEISSEGIDKIEGESEFQTNPRYSGININATGTNVVTVGDGNVVNANFQDLDARLTDLRGAAIASTSLTEEQKLDVTADIEAIRSQLAKASPDKTIIGRLWQRIGDVATLGGFVDTMMRVAPYIAGLLPGP